MRIGYACINLTLAEQNIKVNRSMMKRSFLEKGINYASELALANVTDLEKVIDWNMENNVKFYRMSSDMFPWMSEYEIADLPAYGEIAEILDRVGKKAVQYDHRLSFHPGPFNVLASKSPGVISNTIKELNQHAEIMDLLHQPISPFAKINIHVGGAYGNKAAALERFAEEYTKLQDNVRLRLTVENDDKSNMYSVKDLLWLHEQTGIPIVFDYFHHIFCTGGWSEEEALLAAVGTWPEGVTPVVHFSSPKKEFEDPLAAGPAHADFLYSSIEKYGFDVDIMLEAKAKELALKNFLDHYVK